MLLTTMTTSPALSQARYTAPKATVLSGDLASPWILQLKNNKIYQQTMQRNAMLMKRLEEQRAKRKKVNRVAFTRPNVQPAQPTAKKTRSKHEMDPKFLPQMVVYSSKEKPGTIVIDTSRRFLFLVQGNGMAKRYGVGVGKAGFEWSGTEKISRRAEWPDWRPPAEMRARERKKGRELPVVMAGGPNNPLGARALYLGSTLYRIHGTTQPHTIGKAMSSGCIRMRNEDVIDLYDRVNTGTKVIVM
jgi:lipoprotein-anchoring transpeptidase ErfK/SrfK